MKAFTIILLLLLLVPSQYLTKCNQWVPSILVPMDPICKSAQHVISTCGEGQALEKRWVCLIQTF